MSLQLGDSVVITGNASDINLPGNVLGRIGVVQQFVGDRALILLGDIPGHANQYVNAKIDSLVKIDPITKQFI